MRAIDADALIAQQFKNDISYKAFVNLVKRQPTIKPQQNADCAECKHGGFGDSTCGRCSRRWPDLFEMEEGQDD